MLKKSLFFFFIFFAMTACKKERTIHITATNVATGERIPYLHYYIVQLTEGLNGEKATTVREGDLDANGEAKVTMKLKKTTHVVRVVEPDNSCYTENISLTFGPTDFNAEFKFAPCCNFKRTITNTNCLGPDDKIEVFISRFVNNDFGNGWVLLGCSGYTPNGYSSIPMGNYYFKWVVTRNNVSTTFYDSIFLTEGSITSYLIEY